MQGILAQSLEWTTYSRNFGTFTVHAATLERLCKPIIPAFGLTPTVLNQRSHQCDPAPPSLPSVPNIEFSGIVAHIRSADPDAVRFGARLGAGDAALTGTGGADPLRRLLPVGNARGIGRCLRPSRRAAHHKRRQDVSCLSHRYAPWIVFSPDVASILGSRSAKRKSLLMKGRLQLCNIVRRLF